MTIVLLAGIISILLLAPTLLILAARLLSESPKGVIDEVMALAEVPMADRLAAVSCFHAARKAERRTWLYDATAPLVTAIALLFTKRSADRLPEWASKWDNNVSLNGDGEAVFRDGEWLTAGRDLSWEALAAAKQAGERVYRYYDADYKGDAYYCKGHHPRSWYARYIWLGWRNRASQLSVDLGVDVTERPVCISGSPAVGRSNPGHFLLKQGRLYHYKAFRKLGPVVVIRSYGCKLEYALNGNLGRAPYVAIGRSFKGAK